MKNLARLAAALLLCAMSQSQTITMPIEVTPDPRAIFVMAEINGHKVRLLLDTGSLVTLADPTRTGMSEHDLNQTATITAYDAHASRAIPVVQNGGASGRLEDSSAGAVGLQIQLAAGVWTDRRASRNECTGTVRQFPD
jgi:hypothetical protein